MTLTYQETVKMRNLKTQNPTEEYVYSFLETLNPRYFEEGLYIKEAKENIYASDTSVGSKFDLFSIF